MRLAFLTPSLGLLSSRWQTQTQMVKLAAPTLSGALHAHGYRDIRHYDLELACYELESRAPGRLRLGVFRDDAGVDLFLRRGQGEAREQAELLCGLCGLEEADLFGLSCALGMNDEAEMRGLCNLNLCLAKALKARFPACRTMLGGLIWRHGDERLRGSYQGLLERCPELDYVVPSYGEAAALRVARGLEPGATPLARGVLAPDRDAPQPFIPPFFDPAALAARSVSGGELLSLYGLAGRCRGSLAAHHADPVLVLPMIFVSGCRRGCAFCPYGGMNLVMKREPEEAVRALARLRERHGTRYFHFLNTQINPSAEYARAFCGALRRARLDILWSDSVNLCALDERLLDDLRASGLIRMVTGVESPSDRLLRYVRKGITVDKAVRLLRHAHELGIWNHVQFIAGMPTQTRADERDFGRFISRTAEFLDVYNVSPFHLPFNSPMRASPAEFGLRLLTGPAGDGPGQPFDEVRGLAWPQKQKQIAATEALMTRRLQQALGPGTGVSAAQGLHLELLFFLYDRLGPGRKAQIRRLVRQAAPAGAMGAVRAAAKAGRLLLAALALLALFGGGARAGQAPAAPPAAEAVAHDGRLPVQALYRAMDSLARRPGWKSRTVAVDEGLPLRALSTRRKGPAVWLLAGIHGEEPAPPDAVAASLEALDALADQGIPVVLLPLCNPVGYVKDWRYPDARGRRDPKPGHSVGDSDHLLLDKDGKPRSAAPASAQSAALTAAVLELAKDYPPVLSVDLHEDDSLDKGYIYSQGPRGHDDPAAKAVLRKMAQLRYPVKLSGRTDFDELIVGGIIADVQDGSIDELIAARRVWARGRVRPGPSGRSVLVVETSSMKTALPERVRLHRAIIEMLAELFRAARG